MHAAHSTRRNIRDEAEAEDEDVKASEGMRIFSDAQVLCGASTRDALVRTAVGILDRFASRVASAETKPTDASALTPFASAFAPLASDALRALARLDDDAFRAALFFPVNGDFDSKAIFKRSAFVENFVSRYVLSTSEMMCTLALGKKQRYSRSMSLLKL